MDNMGEVTFVGAKALDDSATAATATRLKTVNEQYASAMAAMLDKILRECEIHKADFITDVPTLQRLLGRAEKSLTDARQTLSKLEADRSELERTVAALVKHVRTVDHWRFEAKRISKLTGQPLAEEKDD